MIQECTAGATFADRWFFFPKKMKRIKYLGLLLPLLLLSGCKTGEAFLDLTQLFQENWRTKTVQEDGLLVYDRTKVINVMPNYSRVRLDLRQPATAAYTNTAGLAQTGTWRLSDDQLTLYLEKLSPATNGAETSVTFQVKKISGEMVLERYVGAKIARMTLETY